MERRMMGLRCLALLVVLAASALAREAPSDYVKTMGQTHSGNAAGVVKPAASGTKGKEQKIGGLDAYVVVPTKPYSSAVLLVTDIFGYKTEGIRRWADRLADAGYLVVVPDYFKGNPRQKSDPDSTFGDWVKLFPTDKVLSESNAVLADVRKQYPAVKKVGVQGFCWGGLYAVLLAQGKTPAVSAAVVYHGSRLTAADVEGVTVPINFQQSDPALDKQIPTELYKQIESVLSKKKAGGLDASITSYPKQAHGFSLRGDSSEAPVAKAANTAFDAGQSFLDKYLK